VAETFHLCGDDYAYYIGTDRQFSHGPVTNQAGTTGVDIAGWALAWMVKRYPGDADASALVSKTTSSGISITGTHNATPSSSTQRAVVTIEDSDTTALYEGLFHYELRRTDAGFETPLSIGLIEFRQGVIR
jgi:hypothetical protein